MLGPETVGVRAVADEQHTADLGLDPQRGEHHLAQPELSEEMLERRLRRPPFRYEARGPGLGDRPDRAVLGRRERRRSELVVTRRCHRRDEHRRPVPGEEHESRDLGSDEPPRRAEQLGHAVVEPGRPLRCAHGLVQRLEVLQAHPLRRVGTEDHGTCGEGDDQEDRGHVVVAGERDGGERDARARQRCSGGDRGRHEHGLVQPISRAAQVSDGETRSRRNRRRDDRRDPPEWTGVILAVDDRVEDDEREAGSEGERRNPKDEGARAQTTEAHASERDCGTGELRDEELVRREHEETEDDPGLVRREGDELGPIAGVRDVQLGHCEDEEQHPELRHLRVERSREITDADVVDDDCGYRCRECENTRPPDETCPPEVAQARGCSQRFLSCDRRHVLLPPVFPAGPQCPRTVPCSRESHIPRPRHEQPLSGDRSGARSLAREALSRRSAMPLRLRAPRGSREGTDRCTSPRSRPRPPVSRQR